MPKIDMSDGGIMKQFGVPNHDNKAKELKTEGSESDMGQNAMARSAESELVGEGSGTVTTGEAGRSLDHDNKRQQIGATLSDSSPSFSIVQPPVSPDDRPDSLRMSPPEPASSHYGIKVEDNVDGDSIFSDMSTLSSDVEDSGGSSEDLHESTDEETRKLDRERRKGKKKRFCDLGIPEGEGSEGESEYSDMSEALSSSESSLSEISEDAPITSRRHLRRASTTSSMSATRRGKVFRRGAQGRVSSDSDVEDDREARSSANTVRKTKGRGRPRQRSHGSGSEESISRPSSPIKKKPKSSRRGDVEEFLEIFQTDGAEEDEDDWAKTRKGNRGLPSKKKQMWEFKQQQIEMMKQFQSGSKAGDGDSVGRKGAGGSKGGSSKDVPSASERRGPGRPARDGKKRAKRECEEEKGVMVGGRKRLLPFSALNTQDRSGRTPLFKYAHNGDVQSCKALIDAGADVNVRDNAGWTPLHEACLEGRTEVVELLIAFGADVNAPGHGNDTPLHDAASNGHVKAIDRLLAHGASFNATNSKMERPCDVTSDKEVLNVLNQWKEHVQKAMTVDRSGRTPLHTACLKGDLNKVKHWIKYGADVNARDWAGTVPLHEAALKGHNGCVKELLRHGCQKDIGGCDGDTALHDAAENDHAETIRLLLQYGANPNLKNDRGKVPLDVATDRKARDYLQRDPLYWVPYRMPDLVGKLIVVGDDLLPEVRRGEIRDTRRNSSSAPIVPSAYQKERRVSSALSDVTMSSARQGASTSMGESSRGNLNAAFARGGLDGGDRCYASNREARKMAGLLRTLEDLGKKEAKPKRGGKRKRLQEEEEESGGEDGEAKQVSGKKARKSEKPARSGKGAKSNAARGRPKKRVSSPRSDRSSESPGHQSKRLKQEDDDVPHQSVAAAIERRGRTRRVISVSSDEDMPSVSEVGRTELVGKRGSLDFKKDQRHPRGQNGNPSVRSTSNTATVLEARRQSTQESDAGKDVKQSFLLADLGRTSQLSTSSMLEPAHQSDQDGDIWETSGQRRKSRDNRGDQPDEDLADLLFGEADKVPRDLRSGVREAGEYMNMPGVNDGVGGRDHKVKRKGRKSGVSPVVDQPADPDGIEKKGRVDGGGEADQKMLDDYRQRRCLPLFTVLLPEQPSGPLDVDHAFTSRRHRLPPEQIPPRPRYMVDFQVGLFLGLGSGRAVLDRYPHLSRRVATTAEKAQLETSPVAEAILACMVYGREHEPNTKFIEKCETRSGGEGFKMSTVDIHLLREDEVMREVGLRDIGHTPTAKEVDLKSEGKDVGEAGSDIWTFELNLAKYGPGEKSMDVEVKKEEDWKSVKGSPDGECGVGSDHFSPSTYKGEELMRTGTEGNCGATKAKRPIHPKFAHKLARESR
ncbi:hypothetical protein HK097_004373 [Rhizophlyctis rosea]|uniref:Uncharacterized protein n=1 Tax=Rhizophlyctis rosea TaxID=64517 RepID=A0AAD5X3K1_9FUNG|nr:hypothetical protein HK097_004373 [Rhizophlyctis rosea]